MKTKLHRGANGYATTLIHLPETATRLCLVMPSGVSIAAATLFMNDGRQSKSDKGGDLAVDGSRACSFWKDNAHDAKAWDIKIE